MKKPKIFTFHIWNPLKELHLLIELKFINKDYRQEYYFLLAFIFFQFEINFRCIYLKLKTFFGELKKRF